MSDDFDLTDVTIDHAQVVYRPAVDPVPSSTTTTEDGTVISIVNDEIGSPAHFEASFSISAAFSQNGLDFRNFLAWACVVPNEQDDAQFFEVETQAARQIAPMLRALADQVEKQVAEVDERRKSMKKTS